ncbi:hypothetical protein BU24DRAFT_456296 [Aaosphaeria arxii CBS 175.79]|uniref:Complex I intermediate-associated protein-like protein 84 n=1 Tax=Aaosphaeria arxii CBS 175.79 TaxID=1450172 RepID=A0A6A5X6W4_9PLEO|nr:uncharacterized protein BU24DRAFT_456296 [Aaosphaeria arxii CBS 175.79]KAF2008524.1 hypothetical protein BU24DRAFT_456296 [Aaosphaeria arxii CBS 175.79]
MPSQLTRVVFRRMLADKPVFYRGCVLRAVRPRVPIQPSIVTAQCSQQRTFLDMFKPQRKVRSAELPPGIDKMGELAELQRVSARLPPPDEVSRALNNFFARKDFTAEDHHIRLAHNAVRYLQTHLQEDQQPWLSDSTIRTIMTRLERRPQTGGSEHLAFARYLHNDVVVQPELGVTDDMKKSTSQEVQKQYSIYLSQYLRVLTLYGASVEAREIAVANFSGPAASIETLKAITSAWTQVLRGFTREDNEEELTLTAAMMEELSIPFVHRMQNVLVAYFASKNNLNQAKYWYEKPVSGVRDPNDTEPHGNAYAAILKACAVTGDLEFGHQVVASLLKSTPNKAAWDAIFVWSAALGKGVDEADRMMNVMVRKDEEARQQDPSHPVVRPDIETINALVEFAISKQDSYSAERYISLGEKRGILPNQKTYMMQVQYRLSVKDIDGARTAYFGLQGAKDEKSVEVINALIRAMCHAKQHHFDDIMAIVDDIHESRARLDPETITAVAILHLRRGEMRDAIDLLQVHAHQYSPSQRAVIRQQLLAFLLDRTNSTADAWDTYQILRQMFPETTREDRMQAMNEFFARQRPDMACHVFFHMRNSTHETICADREVYIAAFTGFARNADAESLELAHNQLKLDLNVDLDTQLRNSLMLAYAGTGNNRRALEYWSDIVASKEGPTYNSIAIAFRSCEGMPWGDQHAKPIWQRLKQMDIDIDKQIFTAYLGAIARNQLHDEAVSMLETVEEEYGFRPDFYVLSNWFNATTNIERQGKVEAWIKEYYPEVWTELEKVGYTVTMDGFGYRQYNINRDLDP